MNYYHYYNPQSASNEQPPTSNNKYSRTEKPLPEQMVLFPVTKNQTFNQAAKRILANNETAFVQNAAHAPDFHQRSQQDTIAQGIELYLKSDNLQSTLQEQQEQGKHPTGDEASNKSDAPSNKNKEGDN